MENQENSREYNRGLVEALIFLSSEPVKLSVLSDNLKLEKSYVRDLIEDLIIDYRERDGGFILKEIAGGFQFLSNEKFYKVLGNIFRERKREVLSRSTLETLAIISYKQPITLPEIDDIRGASSRNMVSTLIAKKLVKAVGQKEVPGRPTLYGTTNEFLIHFGLNKLSDLPTPVEIKELKFEELDDPKELEPEEDPAVKDGMHYQKGDFGFQDDSEDKEFLDKELPIETNGKKSESENIPAESVNGENEQSEPVVQNGAGEETGLSEEAVLNDVHSAEAVQDEVMEEAENGDPAQTNSHEIIEEETQIKEEANGA